MIIKSFNKYIKENLESKNTLIIIDVQKSFRKFFTEMYLNELNKHCQNFENVYQIWDNHIDGKNIDKDYLYDEEPEVPIHSDLYTFPNQKDIIEKRYNYDVDSNFYKKILDKETYNTIKSKEDNNTLKKGETFLTKEGTIITFIGNRHKWFHCPKKLYNILVDMKDKNVEIVGGSDSECLDDIYTTAEALEVNINRNYKYIWSASHCPIK
jgi:hypothetical protein